MLKQKNNVECRKKRLAYTYDSSLLAKLQQKHQSKPLNSSNPSLQAKVKE